MSKVARSQEAILARIAEIADSDFLGWSRELLISYLDYEHAKPFLEEGVTEAEWDPRVDPKADLIEYLDFAWQKALGERGISSERSIDKITQWIWLMGDLELAAAFARAPYYPYGRPMLRVVTHALAPNKMPAHEEAGR